MAKEERRQPELRFKGFTADWEQREFKEIVKRVSKTSNSNQLPKVEFQDIVAGQGRLDSNFIEIYDDRKGIVFRPGNILYGKLRPYLKNWLLVDFKGKAIGDFWVFEENNSNSRFIYYLIQTNHYQRIANDTSGTKMPRSDWNKVSNSSFFIPTTNEQELIGKLFKLIDYTLTLHQRKFDILKDLKEAYLQQIFPEKNHSVPKLRFSNFSNDWKKRVIGDIFIERKQRGAEGELISVTINSGVVKAHELNRKDNSSSNKSNYKRVEVGDIAYNSMRMWQGASGFSKYSGILSPAYTVITPKNDVHSLFFSYYFKNINMIQNFQKYSQGLTSDTWNLKFPSLKEININVPDYSEQKNIANFIVKIDQILLQYENKLSRLEKIKTSLLRKMFI